MRNISFDESTVLRELSRILGEKEMVKVAAPAETLPGPTQNPAPTTRVHAFDEQLLAFPMVNMLNKGQRITDGSALLKELGSPELKKFMDGWSASPDAVGKNKVVALKAKVKPFIEKLQAQLKKMPANYQEAYSQSIANALALVSKASVENDITKEGAEKLYDVSGETGEDLVDQAHKGGGTATELTHSKTDENLVETIVEQQEKDIEVANKVPKGTYATLVNLYNKLSKLGFADKLEDLKQSIQLVATAEEVVEHTLITLADELDNLGYTKQANRVDDLLKKSAASPITAVVDAELVKQQISKRSDDQEALKSQLAQYNQLAIKELIKNILTDPFMRSKHSNIEKLNNYNLSFNAVLKELNNIFLNDAYAKNIQTKAMSSPLVMNLLNKMSEIRSNIKNENGNKVVLDEKGIKSIVPKYKRDPKVLEFQKQWNSINPGNQKLVEDGILGPRTREAMNYIKEGYGSMEAYLEKMKSQKPADAQPSQTGLDKNVVMQELRSAFDRKFRNANYLNSKNIKDYLNQEADKIVQQYNRTPNAVPGTMRLWVNQVISGLTKEDVERAV